VVSQALAIAWRDLRSTYVSPFGIGVTAGFVALSGVLLTLALGANQARLDGWFGPLMVVVAVLASLLTMRSFAEEERAGSLELLLTAPLRLWQVVVGKLLGAAGVLAAITAATVVCPLLVSSMGDPDGGPIVTGYVGLLLAGVAFLAVGLAVSSATSNPLVAAAGSMALLAGLWFAGVVAPGLSHPARDVLQYLSPSSHVTGFLRGTLALVDVTYFLSLGLAGGAGAVAVLSARR
jgi:ABC-2 type transport system permease protein